MKDCFRKTGINRPALEALTDEDRVWLVRLAIAELPPQDIETIFALYYDDETESAVARRQGLCRSAIWQRMLKIKKRLRFRVEKLLKEAA